MTTNRRGLICKHTHTYTHTHTHTHRHTHSLLSPAKARKSNDRNGTVYIEKGLIVRARLTSK